ncbi:MAG: hypothetical protein V4662_10695 [Verrucomicrobiota bacterium]
MPLFVATVTTTTVIITTEAVDTSIFRDCFLISVVNQMKAEEA